jgi:hypothetical protein
LLAAFAGVPLIGFGVAVASAQTIQAAEISNNNSQIAASRPGAPAPADASPASRGNSAAAAGQAPQRTAQGQPPIFAPPAPAASAKACDNACVRRDADFAAQACVPLIEAKAAIDYDWLSRPFGGMFTQAEGPGADGIIRYRGDSIRILTNNQWLRYAYECAFDPVARKLVSVQLRPGRLVPPVAVAQAAGAKVGLPAPQKAPHRAAAKPRTRRHFGEPSPVFVTQAHLRSGQVDSLTRIFQIPLADASRTQ